MHDKVRRLLRLQTAFTSSTDPNIEQVEGLIDTKMDEIDRRLNAAWRISRHTERLSIDIDKRRIYTGIPVFLSHKHLITPLTAALGDVFTIWDGDEEIDYIADKTEGRDDDYWFDLTKGILYLKNQAYTNFEEAVNISYRFNYGGRTQLNDASGISDSDTAITVDSTEGFPYQGYFRIDDEEIKYNAKTSTAFTAVERGAYNTTAATHADNAVVYHCPKWVEELCTKMAAIDLAVANDYSFGGTAIPEIGSSQVPLPQKVEIWRRDVERTIRNFRPSSYFIG